MATIYKIGSKGDGVGEIQMALRLAGYDVKIDSDYGAKTEAAVKAFQRSRGIGTDGIVGPKTLALLRDVLSIGQQQSVGGLTITPGYIYQHVTRCANRPIRYIAIHYTAGRTSRRGQAMQTRGVFLQRSASADFVVDDDTIVQVNPNLRNYYCWAVGDAKNKWTGGGGLYGQATNRNTVSIEMCSTLRSGTSAANPNHEGWSFTPQVLEQTRRLVRYLMQQYGVPRERVVRHYDITGKLCPGVPGWNDGPMYSTTGKALSGRKSTSDQWRQFLASL